MNEGVRDALAHRLRERGWPTAATILAALPPDLTELRELDLLTSAAIEGNRPILPETTIEAFETAYLRQLTTATIHGLAAAVTAEAQRAIEEGRP